MFQTTCLPAHLASPTRSLYQVSWGQLEQTCGKREHMVTTRKRAALGDSPDTPYLSACLPSKVIMTYHIRGTFDKMGHLPQPPLPPLQQYIS